MLGEIPSAPALAEKYAPDRAQINGNISRLRQALSFAQEDNLFVRGSFVRGDAPYGDIDISAYNTGGGYREQNLPHELEGIPISYGFIPLEHLEEYFEECLRGSSSLMETVELTTHDLTPSRIIKEQQQKFLNERRADYLLFLTLEESVSRQKYEGVGSLEYQDLKRKRGSKRTISRMMWAYKAIYPQLYEVPGTQGVMQELVDAGIIPSGLNDSVGEVLTALKSPRLDIDSWNYARRRVGDWFDNELNPLIDQETESLPRTLRTSTEIAIDPEATPIELKVTTRLGLEVFSGYRQWMVLFALSANPRLDEESLIDIFEHARGNYVYRNVIRNLIQNPSFPIKALFPSDIAEDTYAQFALQRRLEK